MAGAIMHSAPLTKVRTAEHATADAARLAELLRADPAVAAPGELLAAQGALLLEVARRRPGSLACSPVVDGLVLTDSPDRVLADGRGEPVPVLGAWNSDEATAFRGGPVVRTDADALESEIGLSVTELRRRWPGWPDDASLMAAATATWFSDPLRRALTGHARVAPTWMLRFDHRTAALESAGLGATHSVDAGFVMGETRGPLWDWIAPGGPTSDDLRVRERMRDAWTSFVASGDPGWPSVSDSGPDEFVMR
jgi:para-nitrobenzyl esterase